MTEEHFSLREMERRKREQSGKVPPTPSYADKTQTAFTTPSYLPSDKEEAVDLRHYFDVILHRKRIIVLVSMLVMLSALYKSYSTKPFYKAKTQILLKESGGGGMLSLAAGFGMGAGGGTPIETLAVISKTTPLLEKVVQNLKYNLSKDDLSEMIKVKPDFDTNILNCTVTAPEEKMAVDTANIFAKTFIEYNAEIDQREATKAHAILTNQVEKTEQEILTIEEKIKEFINREGIISIGAEIRAKMGQMAQLETTIRNLESQLVGKEVEITQIKKKLQKEEPTLITETTATKPLQLQLINLEMKLATTRTSRTEEHPEIIAIKNNIESIKSLVKQKLEETVKVETVGRNPIRDSLLSRLSTTETTIEALKARRVALFRIKKDLSEDINKLPDKQIQFARLEGQKKSIERIFIELQRRFQESRLAKEMHVGNLHHLQPAEKAEKIEKDKKRSGILGLIVGLTIGIGLAFFLEYLDDTVKSVKQVRELFGLNMIGMIPFFVEKERIINPKNPESIISETFRMIQNNLRYTTYMHNQNIIMLASTQRDEGTTTSTINAGISAVMQGKSVLLIDCDLRRASLSKFFGAKSEGKRKKKDQDSFGEGENQQVSTAGLVDYLVDETELKDILRRTKIPNLSFLPAGSRVPNTAELLGSDKMSNLFKILEKQFDVIFVDTPAVLPLVDAPVIASMVNSIIFLIEYRKVPTEAVKQALERLSQSNSNVIGCVINKMKWRKKHYYYYYDKEEMEDISLIEEKRGWYRKLKEKLIGHSAASSWF